MLRVVAVFAVVFQHVTHQAPINHPELGAYPFMQPLQFGATTLLVISAYFVCVTVRRGNTGRWLWRRVARLVPPYLFAVLLTYAVSRVVIAGYNHLAFEGPGLFGGLFFGEPTGFDAAAAASGPGPWYLPNGTDLFANIFMIQSWSPQFHWVDPSYWTLPVQIAAFAIATFLWPRGWGRGAKVSVLLWSMVLVPLVLKYTWRTEDSAQWVKSIYDGLALNRIHLFAVGIAIWLWSTKRLASWHLALLLAVALYVQDAHANFYDTPSTVAFGIVLVFICAAAVGPDWTLLRGPIARAITWLGGISYCVYLIHQELGYVIARELMNAGYGPWTRIAVVLAFAVTGGWLLTKFVERPVHSWLTTRAPALLRERVDQLRAQPQPASLGGVPVMREPSARPLNHARASTDDALKSMDPLVSAVVNSQLR